jgi:hypothetical protein
MITIGDRNGPIGASPDTNPSPELDRTPSIDDDEPSIKSTGG